MIADLFHIFLYLLLAAFFVSIIILYKMYSKLINKHRSLLVKHKVQLKSFETEMAEKNSFVKNHLEEIMAQNIEITESIIYARKIQKAILPPESVFEEHFKEFFIFFKPKQIVSGDFYWFAEKGNRIYVSVADCTGHGVPGAFMSLLGISFLNEIINKNDVIHANEILNLLRKHIIASLRQTGKAGGSKDGMDMSLCVIDKETSILEYAGAYNSVFVFRSQKREEEIDAENSNIKIETFENETLIHLKPDRMPVGFDYRSEGHHFSNQLLKLYENDNIYMFSDGYADQFGGDNNKKFSISRLKNLLFDIQDEKMYMQSEILEEHLEHWQGKYNQIDDILLIGLKV
jgi:serine phosphatase RsbU (regulator of sigma subunit)